MVLFRIMDITVFLKRTLRSALAGVTLIGMAETAHASLIGDQVTATFNFTVPGVEVAPASATMVDGGAPEFAISTNSDDVILVDVGDSWFDFFENLNEPTTFLSGDSFVLGDLDWVGQSGEIVGVFVDQANGVLGLTDADLSFTKDSVTVDLEGVFFEPGSSVRILIEARHNLVPESGTAMASWILGGVVGSTWLRRRRLAGR